MFENLNNNLPAFSFIFTRVPEDNTIEKRLNFKFYEIVYDWAD